MLTEFVALLQVHTLLFCVLGVILGVLAGALPGINGGTLMALALPLTFYMQPLDAQILLIGMYMGDVSGGMIASTLIGVAGSPSSIMTTLDAYPMARKGRAARALGIAIGAQFFGAMVSWLVLAFVAEPLGRLGVKFGPFEMFALVLFGLVMICAVGGSSFINALIAGLLGILCALVGLDPVDGQPRLTFGIDALQNGLNLVPVILGIFAIAPMLADELLPEGQGQKQSFTARLPDIVRSIGVVRHYGVDLLRSSAVGTVVGLLPGIGAAIGATVSYSVARLSSRHPEKFGTGAEQGVISSEGAASATVSAALVPMISLGLPGSTADAFLLAALMIQAIQPGPLLVVEHPDIFFGIIGAALLSVIVTLPIVLVASVSLANVLRVPRHLLTAAVIAFCIIGTYVSANSVSELWTLVAFSVIGLVMLLSRLPLPAFVIGFILGPMAESSLRTGLMISHGSMLPLLERPIPLALLVMSVVAASWIGWRSRRIPS